MRQGQGQGQGQGACAHTLLMHTLGPLLDHSVSASHNGVFARWLCSVVHADQGHIGITPPGYSMAEFKQQDGFEKVEMSLGGDVTTFFRLPHNSARLNTSLERKTSIQVGQAPFGCEWLGSFPPTITQTQNTEELPWTVPKCRSFLTFLTWS